MRKMLLSAVAAIGLLATAAPAAAYQGGWNYHNNPGGWEILYLADDNEGMAMQLGGTAAACGPRGHSYAHMRRVIGADRYSTVSWWIDYDCGSLVRVCVQNVYGRSGCSTYVYEGWVNRFW